MCQPWYKQKSYKYFQDFTWRYIHQWTATKLQYINNDWKDAFSICFWFIIKAKWQLLFLEDICEPQTS